MFKKISTLHCNQYNIIVNKFSNFIELLELQKNRKPGTGPLLIKHKK